MIRILPTLEGSNGSTPPGSEPNLPGFVSNDTASGIFAESKCGFSPPPRPVASGAANPERRGKPRRRLRDSRQAAWGKGRTVRVGSWGKTEIQIDSVCEGGDPQLCPLAEAAQLSKWCDPEGPCGGHSPTRGCHNGCKCQEVGPLAAKQVASNRGKHCARARLLLRRCRQRVARPDLLAEI